MRSLDGLADEIANAELARIFRKASVAPDEVMCRECREAIRQMLQRTLNKMLAAPKTALHEAARNGAWEQYAATVRHLFDLRKDDGHGRE
jgi:glutamyl-tRNA reductase